MEDARALPKEGEVWKRKDENLWFEVTYAHGTQVMLRIQSPYFTAPKLLTPAQYFKLIDTGNYKRTTKHPNFVS